MSGSLPASGVRRGEGVGRLEHDQALAGNESFVGGCFGLFTVASIGLTGGHNHLCDLTGPRTADEVI